MLGSQLSNILSQWDGPIYDGSRTSDVYKWLDEIEKGCVERSIPSDNWPQAAIHFMSGTVKSCMQKLYDSRETWKWDDFKKFIIHIDQASKSDPSSSGGSKHLAAALGILLMGVGSVALAPALGAALLGAVGFTSGGVAAGSLAATIQSVVYGGSTCGLFSILQSAGAAIAPSLITTGLGAVTTAAGAWFGFCGGSGPSGLPPPPAASIMLIEAGEKEPEQRK